MTTEPIIEAIGLEHISVPNLDERADEVQPDLPPTSVKQVVLVMSLGYADLLGRVLDRALAGEQQSETTGDWNALTTIKNELVAQLAQR
jgi:hypothetical protein